MAAIGCCVLVLVQAADAGRLEKLDIRREVKRHLPKIMSCYETHGQLEARVLLEFVIERTGRVTAATASGGDKALQDCMVGVFKRMRFPRSSEATKVTYPIQCRCAGP